MDFSDINVPRLILIASVCAILFVLNKWYIQQFNRKALTQQMKIMSRRYSFYVSFTPTSSLIRRIAGSVRALNIYTDAEIRYNAVEFLENALKFSAVVFTVVLFGYKDLLSAFLGLLFCFVIINSFVTKGIDSINTAQVQGMSIAINRLREAYIRTSSIPDSINTIETPFVLERQFQAIYKMLTTTNGDKQLSEFCKNTPNRNLRTFATACYLHNDMGDVEGAGFNETLSLLKDDVDAERVRLYNQKVMFQSLDRLALIPIFAYPIIVVVYTHMIAATAGVFESYWGYIFKITNLVSSIICYYVLTTMNNSSNSGVDDRSPFYVKLLEGTSENLNSNTDKKYKFKNNLRKETIWSHLSKTLAPHDYRKYTQVKAKLDKGLSAKTVEYFYLEKLGNMIACAIFAFIACIFVTYVSKITVLNSVESTSMLSVFSLSPSQEEAVREYDKEVLARPNPPTELDKEEFERVFTYMLSGATEMDVSAHVSRLVSKYNTYHNLIFKWWFGLVTVAAGILGWFSPDLLLDLRIRTITDEAMRDVLSLQTVIAILVNTTLDTLSVIYWLMRSADIHKYALLDCFNRYPYQPELSLMYMAKTSNIIEFSSIADKLKISVYDIPLEDAFMDLVKDRTTVMKIREIAQSNELNKKRASASPFAKAPMVIWMVSSFIAPVVIVAANSASVLMSNLEKIL